MLIQKALILGGQGAVGMLVGELFSKAGIFWSPVDVRGGASVGALAQDLGGDWDPAFKELLGEADLVVVALPGEVTLRIAARVLAGMRADGLWVDTLSVKGAICRMLGEERGPAERLSINPMFAPALGWEGQSVAWVEVTRGPRMEELRTMLEASHARIEVIGAAAHDELTAATQVATHAAVLAFGRTLLELGYDAKRGLALGTPPHRILMGLLARMVAGNPEVYWEIQKQHTGAQGARSALLRAMEALELETVRGNGGAFEESVGAMRQMLAPVREELAGTGERLVRASRMAD